MIEEGQIIRSRVLSLKQSAVFGINDKPRSSEALLGSTCALKQLLLPGKAASPGKHYCVANSYRTSRMTMVEELKERKRGEEAWKVEVRKRTCEI